MLYQLSPLESVSCWAFRALCTKLGADRTYVEMLRAKVLARHNNSSWDIIDTYGDENCHVQLSANNIAEIDGYFKALSDEIKQRPHLKNIKGYNLNLGCPSPDVIRFGGGAALIKRTTKVTQIIEALCENTTLPVSIKIRLGLNKKEMDSKVYLNLIEACNSVEHKNFNEIIVHLKHGGEKSNDKPHYDLIPEIVEKCNKDLILNGGYSDRFLPKEKVAGVMFARAAINDPTIFSRLNGINISKDDAKKILRDLMVKHQPKPKYIDYLNKYCTLLCATQPNLIKIVNG